MSRIERIEAELAKQIAIAISDGIKDPRVKGLISVSRVGVESELSDARVYVSSLGADGEEEKVIQGLDSAQGYIKSKLRKTMRLRAMPELHFVYDDSIAYGIYMNQRLSEIVKKDEDANE